MCNHSWEPPLWVIFHKCSSQEFSSTTAFITNPILSGFSIDFLVSKFCPVFKRFIISWFYKILQLTSSASSMQLSQQQLTMSIPIHLALTHVIFLTCINSSFLSVPLHDISSNPISIIPLLSSLLNFQLCFLLFNLAPNFKLSIRTVCSWKFLR